MRMEPPERPGMEAHDSVEEREVLLDRWDGRVVAERLADIRAGRVAPIAAENVARRLGL